MLLPTPSSSLRPLEMGDGRGEQGVWQGGSFLKVRGRNISLSKDHNSCLHPCIQN